MKKSIIKKFIVASALLLVGCGESNQKTPLKDDSKEQDRVDYEKTFKENDISYIEYNKQKIILTEKQRKLKPKDNFRLNYEQQESFYIAVSGVYEINLDSVEMDNVIAIDSEGRSSLIEEEDYPQFYEKLSKTKSEYQIEIDANNVSMISYGERYNYSTVPSNVRMSYKQRGSIVCEPSRKDPAVLESKYVYYITFNSYEYDQKLRTVLSFMDAETGKRYNIVDVEMVKIK
ncbi:putative nucleic acid-binding Zn-ribbon protein [Breznakia sp. PF5-3]|uniref:hypothetical protein n=1 Tax=unclassified Breznakia TaxID=2623764 RepID=UPI002405D5CC|nr:MULTISPECIES: hypothetical protein [unclassified Breznakia]MDF9825866.1 putative nucleic acid-binding Zn-ribbon protein [Breznakia sp. PM6-1]MDF9836652.1 putative nucleic acid-binding Zn-ribbon protein [Breznakia sp. PF5-3]MDF9838906.1 putative nucleic acid-binding Zn-ribbon protein [Breznakia sp. PFB2-8]MDF9860927.1 putative nucleic acid-binding Zn-ribbon protein [Breznakia sp. PH5-24]